MSPYHFTAFCLIFCCTFGHIRSTERPLIGILAQETSSAVRKHYPNSRSYISAAYVKSVEGSGARVVPIFIGRPKSYYEKIIKSINGVVLPGGHTYFNNTNGYADAAKIIYHLIKETKDIPVLGICLGLEVLMYLDCKDKDLSRFSCDSFDELLPVKFKGEPTNNKIFSKASDDIIRILTTQKSTYNNHMFCINDESLKKCEIETEWRTISTSSSNGVEFISIAESTSLPIAGLQFHPEKVYEWKSNKNFLHSPDAIKLTRYFFDWLVDLARNNQNRFKSQEEELDSLISNYPKTFTIEKLIYDELYLFDKDEQNEAKEVVRSSQQLGCDLKMNEEEKTEPNPSQSTVQSNLVKTLSFFICNLLLKYALRYLLVQKKT